MGSAGEGPFNERRVQGPQFWHANQRKQREWAYETRECEGDEGGRRRKRERERENDDYVDYDVEAEAEAEEEEEEEEEEEKEVDVDGDDDGVGQERGKNRWPPFSSVPSFRRRASAGFPHWQSVFHRKLCSISTGFWFSSSSSSSSSKNKRK